MQPQSESAQPTLQMQMQTQAWARADALAHALAQAQLEQAQVVVEAGARGWQAPALVQILADAETQALALAEARANAETQMKADPVTYSEVLADPKLKKIIYSMKQHHHDLVRDLWRHSQYWWLIQTIGPITRLPRELLHQILLIIIDNDSDAPFVLMRVSKHWYN